MAIKEIEAMGGENVDKPSNHDFSTDFNVPLPVEIAWELLS